MNREFRIDFHHSVGNLHIALYGEFSGMCAWVLFKTIKRQYAGSGRIFINTAGLKSVLPAGADLFKAHMPPQRNRRDRLYFKGEKGFQIAPDGSRVIICKKNSSRTSFKTLLPHQKMMTELHHSRN